MTGWPGNPSAPRPPFPLRRPMLCPICDPPVRVSGTRHWTYYIPIHTLALHIHCSSRTSGLMEVCCFQISRELLAIPRYSLGTCNLSHSSLKLLCFKTGNVRFKLFFAIIWFCIRWKYFKSWYLFFVHFLKKVYNKYLIFQKIKNNFVYTDILVLRYIFENIEE